jgi:hypothetical protein
MEINMKKLLCGTALALISTAAWAVDPFPPISFSSGTEGGISAGVAGTYNSQAGLGLAGDVGSLQSGAVFAQNTNTAMTAGSSMTGSATPGCLDLESACGALDTEASLSGDYDRAVDVEGSVIGNGQVSGVASSSGEASGDATAHGDITDSVIGSEGPYSGLMSSDFERTSTVAGGYAGQSGVKFDLAGAEDDFIGSFGTGVNGEVTISANADTDENAPTDLNFDTEGTNFADFSATDSGVLLIGSTIGKGILIASGTNTNTADSSFDVDSVFTIDGTLNYDVTQ